MELYKFIYLNKFTYFMIELAHRCSDNGGPTVLIHIPYNCMYKHDIHLYN